MTIRDLTDKQVLVLQQKAMKRLKERSQQWDKEGKLPVTSKLYNDAFSDGIKAALEMFHPQAFNYITPNT